MDSHHAIQPSGSASGVGLLLWPLKMRFPWLVGTSYRCSCLPWWSLKRVNGCHRLFCFGSRWQRKSLEDILMEKWGMQKPFVAYKSAHGAAQQVSIFQGPLQKGPCRSARLCRCWNNSKWARQGWGNSKHQLGLDLIAAYTSQRGNIIQWPQEFTRTVAVSLPFRVLDLRGPLCGGGHGKPEPDRAGEGFTTPSSVMKSLC